MPTITVIGSLNTDLVTVTPRIPEGGETLTASSFAFGCGGKGGNQAVAAARISRRNPRLANDARSKDATSDVTVRMIGAVGKDTFGETLVKSTADDGLDVSGILAVDDVSTGTATILVEQESGENRILVVPGANHALKPDTEILKGHGYGDVVLFQLEIPLDTVLHHIHEAHKAGASVILNPSPAVPLPEGLWSSVDHLILNETEAKLLTNLDISDNAESEDELTKAAEWFLKRGVGTFTMTLGAKGAFTHSRQSQSHNIPPKLHPAEKVRVVDTTAAGDTFTGVYAAGIARLRHTKNGQEQSAYSQQAFDDVVAFAQRAAAITVGKIGAQSAIPWLDEVPSEKQ